MPHILRFDELTRRLRAHWSDLQRITVHALEPLNERIHQKLYLSEDALGQRGLLRHGDPTHVDTLAAVVDFLEDDLQSASPDPGVTYRWRVRGYTGVTNGCSVDVTVQTQPEANGFDPAYVAPTTPIEALEHTILVRAKDAIDLSHDAARGAVAVATDVYKEQVAFLREEAKRLHKRIEELTAANTAKDGVIARLSQRIVDRDRVELEANLDELKRDREELEGKAENANTFDRFERLASKVFDMGQLPAEVVTALKDPEIAQVLANPKVRDLLARRDHPNRELLLRGLTHFAEADLSDDDDDNAEDA